MAEVQDEAQAPLSTIQLDWLVSNLRWFWLIGATLFVLAENYLFGDPSPNIMWLFGALGIGVLINGVVVGMLWAKFFPDWMAVLSVIVDVIVAILLLVFSTNPQYLLPLMLFPPLIAGARWTVEASIGAALPLVFAYATPLLPLLQADELNRTALFGELTTLGVNALVLLLAGAVPNLFFQQRIKVSQADTEQELEQLRIENTRGKLLSEMALTLSSTLDYRKVLRTTIDAAFTAMTQVGTRDDSAIAMVLLFEGDDKMTVAAGRNLSRNDQGRKVSIKQGVIERAVNTAEVTITHRAHRDKSVMSFASTPGSRSAICVPLRAGFQTYGVILFCSTEPNFYTKEHKELLSTFSSQAIIALQNAQLFEDVHREQQRILEKESEARRKLARDLHDGPTQSVAAVVMRLNFIKMVLEKGDIKKAYEEVVKVEEIAQNTTHEIRTMLFAMRPVILETQGLIPALTQYADRLNQNESFRVNIINRGYENQIDGEAEGVIFAIIEEAVGNAKKHSQASEIRITLAVKDNYLYVEIRDNGVGFDVETTQATYDQRTSLGLINMNERAEIVGGQCNLESARGKGTAVKVQLPLSAAAKAEAA